MKPFAKMVPSSYEMSASNDGVRVTAYYYSGTKGYRSVKGPMRSKVLEFPCGKSAKGWLKQEGFVK